MKYTFWLNENIAGRPGPDTAPWLLSEIKNAGINVIAKSIKAFVTYSP